ncbi:hypothetical protein THIOSC15_460002 [uncultured Thiomicrorhabdus sp.]
MVKGSVINGRPLNIEQQENAGLDQLNAKYRKAEKYGNRPAYSSDNPDFNQQSKQEEFYGNNQPVNELTECFHGHLTRKLY